MYSGHVRMRQSWDAAIEAAQQLHVPFQFWPHEIVAMRMGIADEMVSRMPHMSKYRAPGWKYVKDGFKPVDGLIVQMGRAPAGNGKYAYGLRVSSVTPSQLAQMLNPDLGYAFIDEGETIIGAFKRNRNTAPVRQMIA
jgi:hypothetical protein